jgi:hypothetical protein
MHRIQANGATPSLSWQRAGLKSDLQRHAFCQQKHAPVHFRFWPESQLNAKRRRRQYDQYGETTATTRTRQRSAFGRDRG